MSSLLGTNKFNPDNDIPDLSGKDYVVTGGSAGIGFGIAAHLIQHNASSVTILSNKEDHANSALEEIKEAADEVAGSLKKIDALILNAGLGVCVYNETKADKLDSHFQVNHLAQFHLMLKLLPLLQKVPQSRIVFEASENHRMADAGAQFENEAEINTDKLAW